MTHRLTTDCAKNYCNRTLIVKVIVENSHMFWGHSVDSLLWGSMVGYPSDSLASWRISHPFSGTLQCAKGGSISCLSHLTWTYTASKHMPLDIPPEISQVLAVPVFKFCCVSSEPFAKFCHFTDWDCETDDIYLITASNNGNNSKSSTVIDSYGWAKYASNNHC